METFRLLKDEFDLAAKDFLQSPPLIRVFQEDITLEHYKSLLRQLFHQVRDNPQVMILASVYFKGDQREVVKSLCKHAVSEMGHDELARNDLRMLGDDVETLPYENPLPSTMALLSFAFYQVTNLNAVGLLGYVFFLEFLATAQGGVFVEKLSKLGIPKPAMSFIMDHTEFDVAHNRLMEEYVDKLVVSEEEFDSVVYSMKVTADLYAKMIQGAFDQVDNPKDWGLSSVERKFAGKGV